MATKYLTGLIALIKTNLGNIEAGEATGNNANANANGDGNGTEKAEQVTTYFNNTLNHIKLRKKGSNAGLYADIEI